MALELEKTMLYQQMMSPENQAKAKRHLFMLRGDIERLFRILLESANETDINDKILLLGRSQ